MSEFIANFHFLRPWYLLLLILPVVWGIKFFKNTKNKSSWESVIDPNLLDYLLVRGSSSLRAFVANLVLTGFIFSIIAIAGPAWKKKEVPTLSPDNPVIVLLSLSSDMVESDITPDRLARAKFKIGDLLKLIKGSQTGLIVYTNEPFLITPITSDLELVANLLGQIDFDIMPVDGDRPDRAIDLAAKRLKEAGYRNANLVIMAADGGERFDMSLKAAETAGFNISAINISKNDMEKLKVIADKTGGVFSNITADDGDIKRIANLINGSVAEELKLTENMQSKFEDFGYYLLFIPLICCVYLFRRGILAIVFLLYATSAQAAFFLNDNQVGMRDFSAGNFGKAAAEFNDPMWTAAALYRAGKFDEAYEEYSKFDDVESVYNQGNALAKGGKIEEAIAKYEEVLEVEPKHEDAKFNLEYLKQQQQEQEQSQSSSGEGEGEDDQEQQNNNDMDSKPTGSLGSARDDNREDQNQEGEQDDSGKDNKDGSDEIAAKSKPTGSLDSVRDDNRNDGEENEGQEQGQDNSKSENDVDSKTTGSLGFARDDSSGDEDKAVDQQPVPVSVEDTADEGEDYSEAMQAREQQYREIPEDVGGLLRAFILKEYRKNRYGE